MAGAGLIATWSIAFAGGLPIWIGLPLLMAFGLVAAASAVPRARLAGARREEQRLLETYAAEDSPSHPRLASGAANQ